MVIDDFRAEPAAAGWGLMGYSTGGFCAAKLVLQHPDRYRGGGLALRVLRAGLA